MPRKWGFAYVGLTAVLLVALSGPAYAWEFQLKGAFAWSHEWYNQQGTKGFFGNYNVDTANQGTANLNFWNGGQFDTNFVSGANAAWSYFMVDFDPIIKINSALRLYGHYRLGSWGDPACVIGTLLKTLRALGTLSAKASGPSSGLPRTCHGEYSV